MKFTPEVKAALAILRANAENDFERNRLEVLERSLSSAPKIEVLDEDNQVFLGMKFRRKKKGGHFVYHLGLIRPCGFTITAIFRAKTAAVL